MTTTYDIIVVGAGPGGSGAAHFLALQGKNVLLLDKSDFPRDKTCGDGLTPRALKVFEEMSVLGEVSEVGHVIREAAVYAPAGISVSTRVPQRNDQPPYMLAVPRLALDDILRRRAVRSGARFEGRVFVEDIEGFDDGVLVKGRRGKNAFVASGRVAIVAVGASVRLLLRLGILPSIPPMILAARTYYEGMCNVSGRFEFHFDGVPLPGYGWVFPLSETSANVGAGIMPKAQANGRPMRAKDALEAFQKLPVISNMLDSAQQVGPVKGYPLRTDFATAPTSGSRILLVGEAAGLVNPLTGEGIDYALESAQIAARCLEWAFESGSFTHELSLSYDRALREHFQRVFVFSRRIRDWYLRKSILNRLVKAANKRDSLREVFTNVVLGNADTAQVFSPRTIAKILFTF